MSNLRYGTSGVLVAALILIGPIIAVGVIISAEMLIDVVTGAGATVILLVAAGAVGWVLFRKYAGQPHRPQLKSEGA